MNYGSNPGETDKEWMERIAREVTTPIDALELVLEEESYFGYDPYYADIRFFVLEIVRKVLEKARS